MKKRLTVNVDAELIASAKRHARDHGVTLSSLVEESLRDLASADGAPVGESGNGNARAVPDPQRRTPLEPMEPNEEGDTWVERWAGTLQGKLAPPTGDDPRYEYLWYKWRLYESDEGDQRSPA